MVFQLYSPSMVFQDDPATTGLSDHKILQKGWIQGLTVWPIRRFQGASQAHSFADCLYIYISTMFMYIHWDEYISQAHFIEQFGILWIK